VHGKKEGLIFAPQTQNLQTVEMFYNWEKNLWTPMNMTKEILSKNVIYIFKKVSTKELFII
jgi:hypothetical protein